ncbi:MAG: AraC family transcriptional regulator [Bacteroidetes bacterium]|nr:MAG: AraC family transcriptional regulator [Bacteroidota bacterium]
MTGRKALNIFWMMMLISFFVPAVAETEGKKNYVIGFSQCTTDDLWRRTMDKEMQNELIYFPSMKLIIRDAEASSEKQIQDIRELMLKGIDLLIVSPNESEPLTAVVSEVYQKGIPVILIDRNISSDYYTAFLGGNNLEIGQEAAKMAVEQLKHAGRIIEIKGLEGSSPALDRHKGFMDVISKHPGIEVISSLSGNWEKGTAREALYNALKTDRNIDLVFAHNDVMAIGAHEALTEAGIRDQVFIIGVDGVPGPEGGLQAVMDGKIDATLLYPTGGGNALSLANKILGREAFQKENLLNTLVINANNVKALKYQTDVIINLSERIAFAKKNLDQQIERYYSQRFWLIVALSSLLLIIFLASLLLRAYRNKLRANQILENQKKEITRQSDEMMLISRKLEEVTKAKLVFFTNISHEIRTPLTLIIGPLENMLSHSKLKVDERNQLQMMLKNANRLLRLINQLMDLRKVDNDKMQLQACEDDLVSFVEEIKQAFDELASNKKIEFVYTSDVSSVRVYFDKEKLDKILINLISNALKFTSQGGFVGIHVRKSHHYFGAERREAVEIEISDNGPGIPVKHQQRIFERFFQVDQKEGSVSPGTGIGLTLAKGLIDLHKGDITVSSKEGIGSSFFIYLQIGRDHLSDEEIKLQDAAFDNPTHEIIRKTDLAEDYADYSQTIANSGKFKFQDEKPLILIVEDNPDVSVFIQSSLSDHYNIMTAANGAEAFERMYVQEPSLIISDVLMPVMDGLEFTRKLKLDIRTCHIPVILLTARSSYDQKLEGLETGADSYIPKPFNTKHLQVRVRQLIENRQRIRKYYQQDPLFLARDEGKLSQLDSNFLKKCAAVIEVHLSENDYSVEQLSAEVGLSRVHVYRKIKHLTGLSVSEFVRNIKLKKATVLLVESGRTVAEVAYDLGFSSPSYFSKCFREQYNISPSEFISQQADNES